MNKIAIVLGAFHKKEMEQMLVFVKDEIKKHSLTIIKEVWVPGSMEKPLAKFLSECFFIFNKNQHLLHLFFMKCT